MLIYLNYKEVIMTDVRTGKDVSGREYIILSDTYYHIKTPIETAHLLERIRKDQTRMRLYYGDIETGRDWGEVFDVTGKIGRSTGPFNIPILLHNSRSMGGGAILTHCIVKIAESRGGKVLYEHPNYHTI